MNSLREEGGARRLDPLYNYDLNGDTGDLRGRACVFPVIEASIRSRNHAYSITEKEKHLMQSADNSGGAKGLYFDDLTVGQRFLSDSLTVDEQQIRAFASEFDPQPFHLDGEEAKKSVFQGLVASGWHTASLTMRLLVTGGLPIAGGIVGVNAEVSWPGPVRPGAVLMVASEIVELRSSRSRPDRGIVTFRSETRDQNGEVVQVLVATLIVPRRPQPFAGPRT